MQCFAARGLMALKGYRAFETASFGCGGFEAVMLAESTILVEHLTGIE